MKQWKNLFLKILCLSVLALVLTNCSLWEDLINGGDPTPTPSPTATPTDTPDELLGYWKSDFGDGFEVIETAGSPGEYLLYQYDDAAKTVSFSGEIVNTRFSGADAGYLTVLIEDAGTWVKTVGEYYVIHWQNLAGDDIQQACAYKADGFSTLPDQAGAEAEFTVENEYYAYHGDYVRQ